MVSTLNNDVHLNGKASDRNVGGLNWSRGRLLIYLYPESKRTYRPVPLQMISRRRLWKRVGNLTPCDNLCIILKTCDGIKWTWSCLMSLTRGFVGSIFIPGTDKLREARVWLDAKRLRNSSLKVDGGREWKEHCRNSTLLVGGYFLWRSAIFGKNGFIKAVIDAMRKEFVECSFNWKTPKYFSAWFERFAWD